eukprot:Seg894.10 transcript_id=Seg894.10/GoldUCD/mRNA.D3Y31 product="Multidrug and toxin extrusion protein 1" protein_id=Seg894.10/GoldUCD/D3Y31
MAESRGENSAVSLNCQRVTCGQLRQQSRHFNKAFQFLVRPSWLLAFSQLFLSAIPLVTFFFVANVDHESLVSIGYGISVCNMVGIGFCYALAAACEETASEKENIEDAAVTIQRGLFFSFSIVCFPVWAIWMNASSILKGFGVREVHASFAEEYCFTFLAGLPIFMLVLFLQKYMYLIKQSAILPIVVCNLIGAALSFGLNAAFVINLKMGVRGGALATVLTYLCLALFSFLLIMWSPRYRKSWPGWSWSLLLDWGPFAMRLFPYIAWIMVEWWTLDAGIYVIGSLRGYHERTATQVILCFIIHFMSMMANVFTSEIANQVEEAVKAKYYNRAVFIVKCATLIVWIGSIGCGLFLIALHGIIPAPFTNERPFGMSINELIILVSPVPFLKGTQALGFHVLRKIKSRYVNVAIVLIGFWAIALPMGTCLVLVRNWGIRGIWTGYACGLLFQTIFFLVHLKDCMKEWDMERDCRDSGPPTPSGTLKRTCVDVDEVDGVFTTKSLLLKEPRLHMRFNSVEVIREEQQQPSSRPPTCILACRCLLFCFSCGVLITGLVIRLSVSPKTIEILGINQAVVN